MYGVAIADSQNKSQCLSWMITKVSKNFPSNMSCDDVYGGIIPTFRPEITSLCKLGNYTQGSHHYANYLSCINLHNCLICMMVDPTRWLKNHVLFLTTLLTLKACNSPYMQYYCKRFFVLHSSEVIFSFLIKTSRQKQ